MYRGAGRHPAKPQKPCSAGADGGLPHVDGGGPAKPAAGGSLRRYRGDAALRAGAEDIRTLRRALEQAGAGQIRIFAKIESLAGVQALPEFLPLVDEVVIARGDLGNAMPLWELPRCQKQLSAVCRTAGVPFYGGDPDAGQYVQPGGNLPASCEIGSRLAASVISITENVCPRFRPLEFGLDIPVLD